MASRNQIFTLPEERERRSAGRFTGRYLMTFDVGNEDAVSSQLGAQGIPSARAVAIGAASAKALPLGHHLVFPNIGVALVDPAPDQEQGMARVASSQQMVAGLEPERIVRAISQNIDTSYLRGWRDAITAFYGHSIGEDEQTAAVSTQEDFTWGLKSTGVSASRFTGAGVKIAVLDTGFDVTHPDFSNRKIVTQNFVGDGKPFHDVVGHGTHCIGTACGSARARQGIRYGVAGDSLIYAGRVLDDTGRGGDANILQGIDWALSQGCQIISLSLGAPWEPGDPPFMKAYEVAAQRALAAGCLIIAAAGNEASKPIYVGAIGTPGNSPSVLTVAAVDELMKTAGFSNRRTPKAPGVKGPDLAAPGVDICSCWPVEQGSYETISGTSMATPHVAGIAALYNESDPTYRGQALKDELLRRCKALSDASARVGEIGKGLVQAL